MYGKWNAEQAEAGKRPMRRPGGRRRPRIRKRPPRSKCAAERVIEAAPLVPRHSADPLPCSLDRANAANRRMSQKPNIGRAASSAVSASPVRD